MIGFIQRLSLLLLPQSYQKTWGSCGAIDRLYYWSSLNIVFTVDNVKPYHTVNKTLVPEWPTFIDVHSFTVTYKESILWN